MGLCCPDPNPTALRASLIVLDGNCPPFAGVPILEGLPSGNDYLWYLFGAPPCHIFTLSLHCIIRPRNAADRFLLTMRVSSNNDGCHGATNQCSPRWVRPQIAQCRPFYWRGRLDFAVYRNDCPSCNMMACLCDLEIME